MRYILLFFFGTFYSLCAYGQAWSADVEPPDTLRGIAVMLADGGVMTYDSTTKKINFQKEPEGILVPVKCICVRYPIDMVSASSRGQNVGYVTRFFRIPDGMELPANDVLMFKIRD